MTDDELVEKMRQERDKEVYSRVEHWRSSVEALQAERDGWHDEARMAYSHADRWREDLVAQQEKNHALSAQVQTFREALEFYAKRHHLRTPDVAPRDAEDGSIARAALEGK